MAGRPQRPGGQRPIHHYCFLRSPGNLGWWQEHFKGIGVESTISRASSEEERLSLRDPDGLQIDLVASSLTDPRNPWDSASVPAQYAVRGQHSSVLTVDDPDPTLETLTRDLGMRLLGEFNGRYRLSTHDGEPGTVVDIVADPHQERGLVAGGTVQHVAFRVPDQQTQEVWRQELAGRGYSVTAILDRQYFTSIYFREPGGTLLEIATDTPGFNIDEPLLELGRSLKLPPWLEPNRDAISHAVATIELPEENNPAVQAFSK